VLLLNDLFVNLIRGEIALRGDSGAPNAYWVINPVQITLNKD